MTRFLAFLLSALVLNACLPFSPPTPYPTGTPLPTATPAPTPTATVVWFPPTPTPTSFPTPQTSPMPDVAVKHGEMVFQENFATGSDWQLVHTETGSAAIGKDELTIAIPVPRVYVYSLRDTPELSDFYLEVTASPSLCRGSDEYGVLFRATSNADFYRYSLSCDGRVRLDRVINGVASLRHPWSESFSVPQGAPSVSRLGVWAVGKEMRFYIDQQYQFTVKDQSVLSGKVGVFARSSSEQAVTVNFSDLTVYEAASP